MNESGLFGRWLMGWYVIAAIASSYFAIGLLIAPIAAMSPWRRVAAVYTDERQAQAALDALRERGITGTLAARTTDGSAIRQTDVTVPPKHFASARGLLRAMPGQDEAR